MHVAIRDAMLASFPSIAEGAQRLGLESVELEMTAGFELPLVDRSGRWRLNTVEDASSYGRHLHNAGLKQCSLLTACDLSAGDAAEHTAWLVMALRLGDAAGLQRVRVDSLMKGGPALSFGERVARFVSVYRDVIEQTEDLPVVLGLENHGAQGNNLAFLLSVIRGVDSPRFGMTIDTGNFYWRGFPLSEVHAMLTLLAPYARHTHFKNVRYPEAERERERETGWKYGEYVCGLEEGDIDHARVIAFLRGAGYDGDCCIENEALGKHATAEEKAAALQQDVDHVKALLSAEGEDQEPRSA